MSKFNAIVECTEALKKRFTLFVIIFQSLSRTHAVIEVSRDGTILLYDDHSMNGTLRNGSKLKPGVHYAMNGTEDLTFGEVRAKFSSSKSGVETPVKNTNGENLTSDKMSVLPFRKLNLASAGLNVFSHG